MKIKQKKGISLIVLVITIIVMIIIASAIILTLSSNGIIGKANEAKNKSDIANAKQIVMMAKAEWEFDEAKIMRENNNIKSFIDYAISELNDAGYKTEGNDAIVPSENGAVNKIYVGSDNRQAIIPEGFVVSDKENEDTVTEGLVISDEKGNEFVWVPVDDYDQFKLQNWYNEGTFENSYFEPAIEVNSSENLSLTNDLTGEWKEHSEMKDSVRINKGFYIGRYETGTLTERVRTTNNGTTEIVVQKDKPVYNFVAWGATMTNINDDVTSSGYNQGKGAVYLSREMYKNVPSVVSTLCYSVQWDAALKFIAESDAEFPTYSENKGNYTGKLLSTGADEAYSVKNIYDMAGNVFEWTMESPNKNERVLRGSYYSDDGIEYTACDRYSNTPDSSAKDTGFRIALYIK